MTVVKKDQYLFGLRGNHFNRGEKPFKFFLRIKIIISYGSRGFKPMGIST
jgi:hypothetical protein